MDDIVKEAREAIQLSYDFDVDNRREAMEDLRFVAGFQWSDAARQERAGRPMITINRSSQFLRQVSNPIRQNMPTIKVEPDSDDDLNMAEIANGLLRRIQYNSSASHVYATAVEHMVACGIGWFRVVTDYIDKQSFDQELLIKRVFNPLSVYPDPSSLEPDRSNMNFCNVSEMMPESAFKKAYPKASVSGMEAPSNGQTGSLSWGGGGSSIRVTEYWKREQSAIKLLMLKDGSVHELSTFTKRGLEYLKFNGLIAAERDSTKAKVTMHLVSGVEPLADPYECPCQWIPIIPVIGSEIPLENGVYRHGLIRFQREPQQLHNYFMSVAAESLGQQPKAPYAVTPRQIEGFKGVWDNANRKPTPYLPYNPDPQAPGAPQRIAPPVLPTGFVQFGQMLADDMKATTGIYDAALGNKSNETSGVAIGARVEQGNQATYHFSDNLEHGLEHLGRVLLDLIPAVYDTKRTLRLMGEDDTEQEVEVNAPAMQYDDGGNPQTVVVNDLTQLSFTSVRVTMGPSFATKRAETAQNLIQLVQASPMIQEVGMDMVVRSQDFDGAEEMAKRLKAFTELKYPGVTQSQEGPEGAPMQPPGPPVDPMQQQMQQAQMEGQQQAMQFELKGAEAKAAQEEAKAQQAGHAAQGEALKNALLVKKLREPPPRPSQGFDGNRSQ